MEIQYQLANAEVGGHQAVEMEHRRAGKAEEGGIVRSDQASKLEQPRQVDIKSSEQAGRLAVMAVAGAGKMEAGGH